MSSGLVDFVSTHVDVLFGQSEVNKVDLLLVLLCSTHYKVRWFDITMNDTVSMHVLYSCEHLLKETECIRLHELPRVTLLMTGKILAL